MESLLSTGPTLSSLFKLRANHRNPLFIRGTKYQFNKTVNSRKMSRIIQNLQYWFLLIISTTWAEYCWILLTTYKFHSMQMNGIVCIYMFLKAHYCEFLVSLYHQCLAIEAANQVSQISGPGLVVMCRLGSGWDQSTVCIWHGKKAV